MTMSDNRKPAVGRIVHYGNSVTSETPTAAMITAVNGYDVSLVLFSESSVWFTTAKQSDGYKHDHWWWPKDE